MDPHRAKLLSLLTIPLSLLLLLTLLLTSPKTLPHPKLHITSHLQQSTLSLAASHCSSTLYPDLCLSTLSTIPDLHAKTLPEIICASVNRTFASIHTCSYNLSAFLHRRHIDPRQQLALNDCQELLGTTVDDLRYAISDLNTNASSHVDDIRTVLSAAITNQYTCLDGFSHITGRSSLRPALEGRFYHISKLVSNSLALAKKIERRQRRHPRRGVLEGYGEMAGDFPRWVKAKDRRMLATVVNGTRADLVVAKDGSGNFTTVAGAVAVAPNNSVTRFVIYIKAGAYFENVEVGKKQINLALIGDGIGKTVIKANRNVVDGWTTFRSATLAVTGNGFLARDITVENYAGASKHQAVALRVSADFAAFYRCSFVGYQDTLYVHTLRQFYRECDIYGTVDFIFGNAAVVFQNCNLYARKPDPLQKNIFTAQGREDPNQNTGISIQNCKVAAAADLLPVQSNFSSYLGRPWKQYSRTVYLRSQLDSVVDPTGWLEWNGTFALDTLYYGEFQNRGPGAGTTGRVTWPGYRVINSSVEASNFTVTNFIEGDSWLPIIIPFQTGL